MCLVLSHEIIKKCARAQSLVNELRNRIRAENLGVEAVPYRFHVPPDLEYMINSPEWGNEITRFSIWIREAFTER